MSTIPFLQRFRVTEEEAYDAFNLVEDELWKLGVLWRGSKLDKVKLRYDKNGFGTTKYRLRKIWETLWRDRRELAAEGYWQKWTGEIVIPRHGFWWFSRQASIEDVFRHEFGHALADLYPGALKKGGVFRAAFGGSYGGTPAEERGVDGWEERYVSEYATSATQEDFAETFMLFVKHKGKIPARFARKPAIRKKWKAVAEIVKRVAAATR